MTDIMAGDSIFKKLETAKQAQQDELKLHVLGGDSIELVKPSFDQYESMQEKALKAALAAKETPAAWTFRDKSIADKFDAHVREQLPWYDAVATFMCDVAVSFLPSDGLLVDVGASTGNITRRLSTELQSKRAAAISIEPSTEMLGMWDGYGKILNMGAEDFPWSSHSPDVVMMFLTLMFVKPAAREELLKRIFTSIAPGGAVLIVDKGYIDDGRTQVACKAATLVGKVRSGTPADSYIAKEASLRGEQRPTSPEKIAFQAERHGFGVQQIFQFGEFYGLLITKESA